MKSVLTPAKARRKASLMKYEKRVELVRKSGWRETGHWDNWFHPVTGWNYSLHAAVVEILLN